MWPARAEGLITQWFCLHFLWCFEPARWLVLPPLLNEHTNRQCDLSRNPRVIQSPVVTLILIYHMVSVWYLEYPVPYNIKTELGLKSNLISSRVVSCLQRTWHEGFCFPPYTNYSSPKLTGGWFDHSGSRGSKNGWKVPTTELYTLETRQTLVSWSLWWLLPSSPWECSSMHSLSWWMTLSTAWLSILWAFCWAKSGLLHMSALSHT